MPEHGRVYNALIGKNAWNMGVFTIHKSVYQK